MVKLDTGDRIHYLDWGGPSEQDDAPLPPLLLVHGLSQTAWIWAPVARRLRAETRVIAADLRGHGLSDSPPRGYELESLAYDLLTVLVANGWSVDAGGPPVVIAGHGLGAIVAVTMVGLQPASVAGLALVDGGWEDLEEATGQAPSEFARGLAEPPEVMRTLSAYLADRRDYDPGSWDPDQERAARAAVDEKYAGHVGLVTRQYVVQGAVEAMFGYRPLEALAPISAPLVFVVAESGSADDEVARERRLALEDVLRARRAVGARDDRVVRYGGIGHNVMRYRADELSQELLALLRAAATSGGTRGGPA